MAVVASRPDTGGSRADEVDLHDHRHRSGEPLVDAEKNVGRYTHSQLGAQTIMKGTGNPTSHPRTNTLIQVYFNAGLAYVLDRQLGVAHGVTATSVLIGASNFFELAVASAIVLFGFRSGAELVTVSACSSRSP